MTTPSISKVTATHYSVIHPFDGFIPNPNVKDYHY